MEHFLASQVEITYVLSLYPYIVLPKSSLIPEPEKFLDITGDDSYLSRGSSGVSDYMESPTSHMLESDDNADIESKKLSHNTLMALVKFIQKKRYSIIEKDAAEETDEVVSDAVGSKFVPYASMRPKKASKVVSYLLTSAASSAVPLTNSLREGADNIFTDSSASAISMKFLAFFALAISAIISGYKLATQTYI